MNKDVVGEIIVVAGQIVGIRLKSDKTAVVAASIAVPMLFKRLKNLRLDPDAQPVERGWVFRGPTSLPVVWDHGE